MGARTYGQYCGIARALELVGDRWALLVVRDLIPGPKRYTDLQRGLPRIPTNVLSARLKELEQAGIVERRVLPRPSASVVYDLTGYGRELEDVLVDLMRWGVKSLDEPAPDTIVRAGPLTFGLRAMFRPEAAGDLRVSYELRVGDAVVHARVADGALEAGEGTLADAGEPGAPDLALETDPPTFRALMAGELTAAEALRSHAVRATGAPELFERFVELFQLPQARAPTAR